MSAYLDGLDLLLADGLAALHGPFTARQVAFVLQHQRTDGGFRGRQGTSDPYYTDFALRTLALLAPETPTLPRAAEYLANLPSHNDVVDVFSRLNAARLLVRCGVPLALVTSAYPAILDRQRLAGGGFTRPGGQAVSAYDTFLAVLCYGLLDTPCADSAATVAALQSLRRAEGGYAALAGETASQTNATAAAAGALTVLEATYETDAVIRVLADQQAADGGLRAHAASPIGDLLSTFTGLLTLVGLGGAEALDLPALARFVKHCAHPAGGFTAGPHDTEADVEYTYYGLGCLALLRLQTESDA